MTKMIVVRSQAKLFTVFGLILVSCLLPAASQGATRNPVEIRSIEMDPGSETDFLISASYNFQFYMFALKNPERLVIDCRPAVIAQAFSTHIKDTHPVVRRIRADRFDANVVRVVFDLKHQAKYSALMNGTDLRIRISSPASVQHASGPNDTISAPGRNSELSSNSQKVDQGIELSVSTETPPTAVVDQRTGKTSAAKKPEVQMRGYVVDKFERKVVGSQGREPSTGSSYSLALKYRKKSKSNNAKLKMDYTISGHEYAELYADDYMSQDFKLGYELKLSPKWTLKNVGSVGMYEYGSEYGFRPEFSYRVNEQNEMSFFAGHRTKVMDYYSERTDQDRFFGAQYRRRLLGNHVFKLRYQRNFNDSERDRYDYVRSRYTIEYNVPWTRTARSTIRLDYSPREYQSRFIAFGPERDPELGILRYDEGWTFSLMSRISLSRHLELVPRYIFQDRISNDPSVEDFSLHVSSIALRGRW